MKEKGGTGLLKENETFADLLAAYRSIWNNRLLETGENGCEEILTNAIKRELLDENSHPRVRKTCYEKFYSAIKRVTESPLKPEMKSALITLHVEIMGKIS